MVECNLSIERCEPLLGMHSCLAILNFLLLASLSLGTAASSAVAGVVKVDAKLGCTAVQEAIRNLPTTGGTVRLGAGVFTCSKSLVIDRDDVILRGAGKRRTTLRLANATHLPLLIIGNPKTVKRGKAYEVEHRVRNIRVSDLTVDGNLKGQNPRKECGQTDCDGDPASVRNNAITIRGASHVTIQNVIAHSSISGGLVTEKNCDNLLVEKFESYGHFFDGFAGYQTENSVFRSMHLHDNRAAGLSIDIHFNHNKISDVRIENNGSTGIFARELSGNVFENIKSSGNVRHQVFLASSKPGDKSLCASDNEFKNLKLSTGKSTDPAFRVNDSCPGNVISGKSQFEGPTAFACVSEETALTKLSGNAKPCVPQTPTAQTEN